MKNTSGIIFAIVGFLIGLVAYQPVAKVMGVNQSPQYETCQKMMSEKGMMMHAGGMSMGMDAMVEELQGKSGDGFDETFTRLMIDHHQGAIDMAELAQKYAGHNEIKNLANEIIKAQTNEIQMMREWRSSWGY